MRSILKCSVSLAAMGLACPPALAQDEEGSEQEAVQGEGVGEAIVVRGYRLQNERTIHIQRNAEQLVHSVTADDITILPRSDERREGKECVSMSRSRWSPSHEKKNE